MSTIEMCRAKIMPVLMAAVLVASAILPSTALAVPGETIYTGENTNLSGDDDSNGPVPIGFPFVFYGDTEATVSNTYVNINGTLNFDTGHSEFSNETLPTNNMGRSIMAFWDDIITKDFADKSILYKTVGTPGSQKFITQWTNMYFYSNPSIPMGTFQVILYEGTNKIQLQYRDLLGGDASRGDSATIGINQSGALSSQVSFDTAFLEQGQAISFTPNGSNDYTVNTNATYDAVYLSDAAAPATPILSAPSDNATSVSTTPTFTWSAANLADSYQLIAASDSNYTNIVINQSGLTGASYTPETPLNPNTNYYWKVIAINGVGSTISNGRKFTTGHADDNDGVDQSVEASAPNGGDANNDSTNDNEQANVTSLVDPVTNQYTVLETSGCPTNTNVSIAGHTTDTGYTYPAGLMNFTLTCGAPGGSATITLYYYGINPSGLVLRKYNSTTHEYSNVNGATITSETIGGQSVTKVVYSVTDGSDMDEDGLANGVIVDPIGLAQMNVPGAPNTGQPRSQLSIAYIIVPSLMVLLITAIVVRLTRY